MDALTPIALIAFVAQFLMWLGLPDRPATPTTISASSEAEAMAA
jgi:hypothetical protein